MVDNSLHNEESNKPIYYRGEIAAKFSGPISVEQVHRTLFNINLYNARIVKTNVLDIEQQPQDALIERGNTYRCDYLTARLYLGDSQYYQKRSLYNVWIEEVEISKTRIIDGEMHGVLRGFITGTYISAQVNKQKERLIGNPEFISKGELIDKKIEVSSPLDPIYVPPISDGDYFPDSPTYTHAVKRWWDYLYFWNWFGSFGCLGTLWNWFWYIVFFIFLLRGCDRCSSYVEEQFIDDTTKVEKDDSDNYEFSETDLEELTKEDIENDSLNVCAPLLTKHKWLDYDKENYEAEFPFCANDVKKSTTVRKRNDVNTFEKEYSNIILNDYPKLKKTIAEYKTIAVANKLNKKQLADMVVSSIQAMEYWIVHHGDHQVMAKSHRNYYNDYCLKGKCLPHIDNFGVLAPLEFLKMKRGDCDSRTVFLYAVLNGLGIDTTILNSPSHSIIGVAGIRPDQNDYIKVNNKRYYVWETTAKGWRLGQFPNGSEALYQFKPVRISKT